ncbi:sigma factor-like helix-turn-helix DNA-binding protein [Streptomyces sp. NPDC001568]|uniref:sigma factor-like helix-turn-helix DNA-binding protein n=1 Tax=Streptomyces sp. NPDC001568 TaxID=3364588 RepID=UPI0036CD6F11
MPYVAAATIPAPGTAASTRAHPAAVAGHRTTSLPRVENARDVAPAHARELSRLFPVRPKALEEGTREIDPAMVLREDIHTLAPLLRELDERDREVLRMRFALEMTQSEIEAELGHLAGGGVRPAFPHPDRPVRRHDRMIRPPSPRSCGAPTPPNGRRTTGGAHPSDGSRKSRRDAADSLRHQLVPKELT